MAVFRPAKNDNITILKGATFRRTYKFPFAGPLIFAANDTIWVTITDEEGSTIELIPAFSTADTEPAASVTIDTGNNAFGIFIPHTITGGVALNIYDKGFYDIKFVPIASPNDVSVLARGKVTFVKEPKLQGEPT